MTSSPTSVFAFHRGGQFRCRVAGVCLLLAGVWVAPQGLAAEELPNGIVLPKVWPPQQADLNQLTPVYGCGIALAHL